MKAQSSLVFGWFGSMAAGLLLWGSIPVVVVMLLFLVVGCESTPRAHVNESWRESAGFDEAALRRQFVTPDTFAGYPLVSFFNYEEQSAGMGYSLSYGEPGVTITLYVYDEGVAIIPDGIESDVIERIFQAVVNEFLEPSRDL